MKQQPSEDGGTFRIGCRRLGSFSTYLGNLGLSRSDQDGGGSQADPPQKRTGPAFTSSCVLSTARKTALDVSGGGGGGRELLWMRSGRPGRSGGALQTVGPPMDKERRERFSGSAPEIPQSRCQSRNPANCYNNCDSLAEGFNKVSTTFNLTLCLLTLALSQPLAARSCSSSKSITSRYCGTSCHPM